VETMAALDAKFLYSETPTTHMHTIKVAVSDVSAVEGGFSYDNLTEVLQQLLVRLPPFRRRVVSVPGGLGPSRLGGGPGFRAERATSLATLADPGGDHQLAAAVAAFASKPLLRDRPLWELLVLEGLARGRIAVVVKIHHAVADGSAAVALLRNAVQGVTAVASIEPIDDPWHPEPIPTRRQLLSMAAHDHVTRWKGLPHLVQQSIKQTRASEHRRRTFAPRPPLPLHHIPKTSFNVSITSERTFAMTNLPLGDLKAIRRAAGTT
jgi:diacylglycerol O-acyltransferase